jgi:hypothetical protein
MSATRYWVRFKDHLDSHAMSVFITVLSRAGNGLSEGATDREFVVELRRQGSERVGRFERTLVSWKDSGWADWRKI